MKKLSRKNLLTGWVLVFMACCFLPSAAFGYDITIDVAPNVISIGSNSTIVTVHTDIAYGDVVGSSVFLNGVPISWWKMDNQGYFVAKFESEAVKDIVIPGEYNTLALVGVDIDGAAFGGSQDILVIDVGP